MPAGKVSTAKMFLAGAGASAVSSHMISAFGQLLKWNSQDQVLIIPWVDLALGFPLFALESVGQ